MDDDQLRTLPIAICGEILRLFRRCARRVRYDRRKPDVKFFPAPCYRFCGSDDVTYEGVDEAIASGDIVKLKPSTMIQQLLFWHITGAIVDTTKSITNVLK